MVQTIDREGNRKMGYIDARVRQFDGVCERARASGLERCALLQVESCPDEGMATPPLIVTSVGSS